MTLRLACLFALALLVTPASADLAQGTLDEIALAPPPGAALPTDAVVRDADAADGDTTLGAVLARHPASLVVFADYTCQGVCGTALAMATDAFASPDMRDLDAGLVVIGLDPADDRAAARAMRDQMLPAGADRESDAAFLLADAATVARLTAAVGYRYRYDFATDQFAHPAAALAVASDGRAGRPLAELSLTPETLRRALVEASEGRAGTILEQIVLRCYSFDPATGLYMADATRLLRFAGLLTLCGLAALVLGLTRRGRA